MEQYLFQKQSTYTFDFRKPRVKETRTNELGSTTSVMDKFSIGYVVGHIDFYKGLYLADVFSYADCKQKFLELLEQKQFNNVTIIK